MKGSNAVTDSDEIVFIRSRLETDSRTLNLMESSAFNFADFRGNAKFKENSLNVFGNGAQITPVKQLVHVVEELLTNVSSCSVLDGPVGANQLSTQTVKILMDIKWLPNDDEIKTKVKVMLLVPHKLMGRHAVLSYPCLLTLDTR